METLNPSRGSVGKIMSLFLSPLSSRSRERRAGLNSSCLIERNPQTIHKVFEKVISTQNETKLNNSSKRLKI